MGQLTIGDLVINYVERPSQRAKRIIISVKGDQVSVSYPKGMRKKEIRGFVESKREWISKHIQAHLSKQKEIPLKKYEAGERFPYQGREIVLGLNTHDSRLIKVKLVDESLQVWLPHEVPHTERPEIIKLALVKWYKGQAQKVFKEKLDFYAKQMGVTYNEMRIKDQKTRWGSCSARGNINLNWRVLQAPDQVLNYLVIHELAHLKHLNHSLDFWHLVESYMPDYKRWKKWLAEHGRELEI